MVQNLTSSCLISFLIRTFTLLHELADARQSTFPTGPQSTYSAGIIYRSPTGRNEGDAP